MTCSSFLVPTNPAMASKFCRGCVGEEQREDRYEVAVWRGN